MSSQLKSCDDNLNLILCHECSYFDWSYEQKQTRVVTMQQLGDMKQERESGEVIWPSTSTRERARECGGSSFGQNKNFPSFIFTLCPLQRFSFFTLSPVFWCHNSRIIGAMQWRKTHATNRQTILKKFQVPMCSYICGQKLPWEIYKAKNAKNKCNNWTQQYRSVSTSPGVLVPFVDTNQPDSLCQCFNFSLLAQINLPSFANVSIFL